MVYRNSGSPRRMTFRPLPTRPRSEALSVLAWKKQRPPSVAATRQGLPLLRLHRSRVRGASGMSSETRGLSPTVASSGPEDVGESDDRVCVGPWLGQNIDRASSARDANFPSPARYGGRCWRRRASDIGRSAWRVTGRRYHGAFWLRILEPCSGPLAGSHFSAIPFEEGSPARSTLSLSSSALRGAPALRDASEVEILSRPW